VKPRQSIALSLLAALSLHAVVLLTVRMAGQGDSGAPTIELALESARPAGAGPHTGPAPARRAAATTRAAAAAVVLPTPSPAPAQLPAPAAPSENSDASPQPVTMEPAAGSFDVNDQAPASGAAAGGAVTAGTDSPVDGAAVAPLLTPPHPKAEILPTYPRSARRAGLEGIVRIAAFVDESGHVVSAEVLSSSGHDALDQAALQAVQHASFEPALQAGKPVPCRLIIPVRFKLN
jgi:protein TonB